MKKIIIKEKDIYNISPLLKGVMDLAFDASCIMDKDGVIVHCSDSSPLIWGRPNEESIGMHISELDSASPYPELLETGKPVMNKLHIINGRTCITHMIPLFDKRNNIVGAFGVIIFRGMEKIRTLIRENVLDEHSVDLYQSLSRTETKYSFDDFFTQDERMKDMIRMAKSVAKYDHPVLISGETGTGKEIFAYGIHMCRAQNERLPFVRVNCAAIPPRFLETELFGCEKGSFPGAHMTKRGKFEIAGNGTILLDEIGNIDTQIQAKLLRVVEDREFERIGGNTLIPLKARVIATTNCNIYEKIREGLFRRDLYFRFSAIEFKISPLRERPDDIPLLVRHFLSRSEELLDITPDALEMIRQYSWPGNVRQLRNFMTKLSIVNQGHTVTAELVQKELRESLSSDYYPEFQVMELKEAKKSTEKTLILRALAENHFNISKSAQALGISRNTLYKYMELYDIPKNSD